jgi:hypothetical protein
MEPLISGAVVPYMPEMGQNMINAGVSVFELRHHGKRFFNRVSMGPYGAKIIGADDESGRMFRPRVEWRTGAETQLFFEADAKGVCIAWMADDPWWHNRLHLMLEPWLLAMAVQRHTPRGLIPGYIIQLEIQAMRTVLRKRIEQFDVFQDGRALDHFNTKEAAEEFVDSKQTYELKADKTGQLRNIPMNKRAYTIKPGSMEEYKPEIRDLIDKYKRLQFGWTSCLEFKNEIRPQIEKEIERLKQTAEPQKAALAPEDLAGAIANWGPEERQRFSELLLGNREKAMEEAPEVAAELEPGQEKQTFNKTQLTKMTAAELKVLLGTEEDLTRNQMIDKILVRQSGVVVVE